MLTGIGQAYHVALSFLSGILMARLLSPDDFGLVAMVLSCVAFITLIQDLGLNQATIQRERISRAQSSALFWLLAALSLALALVLAAGSPLIAAFFGDARLVALTTAFSVLVFISGCQSQHYALLNRDLKFKALAAIDALKATIGAVVGVTAAWLTASYWSLFAASMASALVGLVGLWIACSFRPGRPSFESDFRDIMRFGSGVSGFNLVNYFARNADKLLIGHFYGAGPLGLYDRAYRLLLFPLQQIQAPLGRVMLPLLSRLQSDPERYRKAYTECVALMLFAAQPGLVFVVVFAEDVFGLLLGPHWLPAAPIFRWLGVCGLHQVMTSTVGWLYLSQGRGGDLFRNGLFNAITTVASFVAGLPWGATGVAVAYTITDYLVRLPATWWSAGRRGPVSGRHLVTTTFPHVVATIASALVLLGLSLVVPTRGPSTCLGLALTSYAIYGLVLLAFPSKRLVLGRNARAFVGMLPSWARA
jgi:PST family polysaccharide transporter